MSTDNRLVCYNKPNHSRICIDVVKLLGDKYELSLKTGNFKDWKFNFDSTILKSLLREACKTFLRSVIPHLRVQSSHISLPCPPTLKIVEVTSEDDIADTCTSTSQPQVQFPRTRIIALPFNTQTKSLTKKRKKVTVASLLGDVEYYTCKNCFKSFNRKFNRFRHEVSCQTSAFLFHCYTCTASYQHPTHFADHVRTHENIKIECHTCEKQFTTKGSMRAHSRLHKSGKSENLVTPSSGLRRDGKRKCAAVQQSDASISLGSVRIPIDFKVEM
ncbi:unnamed protein product [Auanema sp. JU1783]|nr:unnamed protein product [Auanema sp. JU1783]